MVVKPKSKFGFRPSETPGFVLLRLEIGPVEYLNEYLRHDVGEEGVAITMVLICSVAVGVPMVGGSHEIPMQCAKGPALRL